MRIDEQYHPQPISDGEAYDLPFGKSVAGFLCTTDGTLTIYDGRGSLVVNTLPVTAGVYHPIPFFLATGQLGRIEADNGASGVIAIV